MTEEFLKEFAARYYELEAEGLRPMQISEKMQVELDCKGSAYQRYLRIAREKKYIKNTYAETNKNQLKRLNQNRGEKKSSNEPILLLGSIRWTEEDIKKLGGDPNNVGMDGKLLRIEPDKFPFTIEYFNDDEQKVTKEPIVTEEEKIDDIPMLSEYEENVIVDLSESKYIIDRHVSQEPSITTPNHITYSDEEHTKTETPKVKKKQSWVARLLSKLFGKK